MTTAAMKQNPREPRKYDFQKVKRKKVMRREIQIQAALQDAADKQNQQLVMAPEVLNLLFDHNTSVEDNKDLYRPLSDKSLHVIVNRRPTSFLRFLGSCPGAIRRINTMHLIISPDNTPSVNDNNVLEICRQSWIGLLTRWVVQRAENCNLRHLRVHWGHYHLSDDAALRDGVGNVNVLGTVTLTGAWSWGTGLYLAKK